MAGSQVLPAVLLKEAISKGPSFLTHAAISSTARNQVLPFATRFFHDFYPVPVEGMRRLLHGLTNLQVGAGPSQLAPRHSTFFLVHPNLLLAGLPTLPPHSLPNPAGPLCRS